MSRHNCFHRVLLRISGFYDYHTIPVHILLYHSCSIPQVSCFYHLISTCSRLDIDYCLSTYSCMLVLTTQFSMHVYNLDLSIHVCLSMLATWHSHHHSPGSSDSSGSSCPGLGAWSVWILLVADQSGAVAAWISSRPFRAPSFQAPCSALEFSCYDSEPVFVLFILVHLLVFSHLRLSVM